MFPLRRLLASREGHLLPSSARRMAWPKIKGSGRLWQVSL